MKKMNLGCGPDIQDGWVNVDKVILPGIEYWDAVNNVVPENWKEEYDFILINHVLCTMMPKDVNVVLEKVRQMLKTDGIVHIIDMDITMAIAMYQNGHDEFPVKEGTIDYNFLMHVSGYGTRPSLFTPRYMAQLLTSTGFRNVHPIPASDDKYDFRELESLRFEGTK